MRNGSMAAPYGGRRSNQEASEINTAVNGRPDYTLKRFQNRGVRSINGPLTSSAIRVKGTINSGRLSLSRSARSITTTILVPGSFSREITRNPSINPSTSPEYMPPLNDSQPSSQLTHHPERSCKTRSKKSRWLRHSTPWMLACNVRVASSTERTSDTAGRDEKGEWI